VYFIVHTLFTAESGSEAAQVSTPGEAQVECPRRRADGKIPTQAMAKGALDDAVLGAPNGRCWHVKGSGSVSGEPGDLVAMREAWAWRWHAVLVVAACAPLSVMDRGMAHDRVRESSIYEAAKITAMLGAAVQTVLSTRSGFATVAAAEGSGFGDASASWQAVLCLLAGLAALGLNMVATAAQLVLVVPRQGMSSSPAMSFNGIVWPPLRGVVALVLRLVLAFVALGVLFCVVYVLAWGMSPQQAYALATTVGTANMTGWCWLVLVLDVWLFLAPALDVGGRRSKVE